MKEQEGKMISSIKKLFRSTPRESAKESNTKEIIIHVKQNIKQNHTKEIIIHVKQNIKQNQKRKD